MRPVRLEMQAFGPYERKTVIDFTVLGENNFFLIDGATGAGKTSIFDAMCYALYGRGSTDGRNKEDVLRNSESDAHTPMYVDFVFQLGEEKWHVLRGQVQELDKRTGKPRKNLSSVLRLERLLPAGGAEPYPETGVDAINGRIADLIGLQLAQFRQVVLLPQGEFQRFLKANTKERAALMEKLFNAGIYKTIAAKLKAKRDESEQAYQLLQERQKGVLSGAGVADVTAFTAKLEAGEKQVAALAQDEAPLLQARDKTRQALEQGRAAAKLLQAREAAEKNLAACRQQVMQDAGRKERLARAEKAAGIADVAAQAARAQQRTIGKREELAALQAEGKKAHEREAKLHQLAEQAEAEAPARQKLQQKWQELQNLLPEAARWERVTQEMAQAQQAAREAKQALQQAVGRQKAQQEAQQQDEAELQQLREQAAVPEALQAEQQNLQQEAQRARQAAAYEKQLQAAQDKAGKAKQALQRTQEAARCAEHELRQKQQAARLGRAFLVAQELREGEPCPVCGATEHPHPAVRPEDMPGDEELEAADVRLQQCRHDAEQAQAAWQAADSRQQALQGSREALGEVRPLNPIMAELQELQEKLAAAMKAKERQQLLAQKLVKAKEEAGRLQLAVTAAQQALADKQNAATAAETARQAVAARLPEAYRPRGAAAAAVARAQQTYEEAQAAAERTQKQWQDAKDDLIGKREAYKRGVKAFDEYRQQEQDAQAQFASRLAEAGFADAAAYREALAGEWQRSSYRQQVQQELNDHQQQAFAAQEALAKARQEAEGISQPDLTALTQAAQQAEQAYEAHRSRLAAAQAALQQLQAYQKELAEAQEQGDKVRREYEILQELSDVANGGRGSRVTFQNYVLHSWLLDVIAAANGRLLRMTRDRYELRESSRRAGNALGGLDMEIVDNDMGTTRALETLSGGESFLAALALALGLSDTVQTFAGGIHLDTMLIDEGFGTLDSEALDIAMRALIQLQRSGRLIGIISHVKELKQCIPTQLEVSRLPHGGSTARFVFGTAAE